MLIIIVEVGTLSASLSCLVVSHKGECLAKQRPSDDMLVRTCKQPANDM